MSDDDNFENQEDSSSGQGGGGRRKEKKGAQDRSAAAKAFYRAMYAGGEPDPDAYGLTPQDPGVGAGGGGGGDSRSCAYCSRMQSDLEAMEAKANESDNLYKRLAADFENYRKRMQREKEEFTAIGIQRAIENILPALDDMDMAKQKLTTDMDSTALMDSLNLVYSRFARCLEQIGITQLSVIGEQFDPKFHEPVQQVVTNEVPDGAVYQQLRPGYMYNDKVLRPTLVNVATSDGAEDYSQAPSEDAEDSGEVAQEEPAFEEQSVEGEQAPEPEEADQQDIDDDVVTLEPGEYRANLTQDLPIYEIDDDALTAPIEEAEEQDAEK